MVGDGEWGLRNEVYLEMVSQVAVRIELLLSREQIVLVIGLSEFCGIWILFFFSFEYLAASGVEEESIEGVVRRLPVDRSRECR